MLACLLLLLAAPQGKESDSLALAAEMMRGVNAQVAALRAELVQRHEAIEGLKGALAAVQEDVKRGRTEAPVSAPFLAAPPAGSDSLGVAKAAVFAPRVDTESPRRRDTILLKLKRVEPGAIRTVAEVELVPDQSGVDLPLDQNGALFIVEWSTSEGQTYNLVLRDGASGQPVATVPVKPLQSQGRFVFVGYRVE
jgi:hypothetical protein